jgi:hypothetical protein
MNGSIISIIQEKRKLFYTGILKNEYKPATFYRPETETENRKESQTESGFGEKGFKKLQNFFAV